MAIPVEYLKLTRKLDPVLLDFAQQRVRRMKLVDVGFNGGFSKRDS